MKRLRVRISTLMLFVVIAGLSTALFVQKRSYDAKIAELTKNDNRVRMRAQIDFYRASIAMPEARILAEDLQPENAK